RESFGCVISESVAAIRSSDKRFRKGDCSNCAESPWRKASSKTGSPVLLAISASTIVSLSVRGACRLETRNATRRAENTTPAATNQRRDTVVGGPEILTSAHSECSFSTFGGVCGPGGPSFCLSVTGAINRYPRFGTVSIYCCPPGASPSALRTAEMLTVRFASSTKLSGQTSRISSSFIIRRPLLRTRASRISNDFGDKGTGLPSQNKSCSRGSQQNLPNS